jgi:ABC-type multidrug transport system fused ATPase/permease subunit
MQQQMTEGQQLRERLWLAFLIGLHIVICCVSLVLISRYRYPVAFAPATFHIFFDSARSHIAILVVAAFALVSFLFVVARFSFGYFAGFYLYTMILSYLWLNCFTNLNYDHRLSGYSAALSAVAFLVPALFVAAPIRQLLALSPKSFDRLLSLILVLGAATLAVGAFYNFRIVAIDDIYEYRDQLSIPAPVKYLLTIVSSALLPFAFAGFVANRATWRAVAALILLFLFYPITLAKISLFTPFWLIALLVLSKLFPARTGVVLSLLFPMLAGLGALVLFGLSGAPYFVTINFRLIAVPAVAMDVYNDFFSRHDLTHFCQISFLKPIMDCPYQEQLSLVMEKAYKLGNFNGSLFVTEGIASVGTLFAPLTAFACGLVIALGNRVSAGLPAGFMMVSGAVLPQALLNVPLTVTLLTHGAGLLFLLWYITPREIFECNERTDG